MKIVLFFLNHFPAQMEGRLFFEVANVFFFGFVLFFTWVKGLGSRLLRGRSQAQTAARKFTPGPLGPRAPCQTF